MDKFEYKTYTYDIEGFNGDNTKNKAFQETLNQLGRKGWELVNSVTSSTVGGEQQSIVCIFKRSLIDGEPS